MWKKNRAPSAAARNGRPNIPRGNGNATTAKEYVKNALPAMRRTGSRGSALHVPVGEGRRISLRSTKGRVRNGVVARACTHACPRCGTEVQSAKASGKIQSKHRMPNGKTCPTTTWVAK